jgi:hypothetical protein
MRLQPFRRQSALALSALLLVVACDKKGTETQEASAAQESEKTGTPEAGKAKPEAQKGLSAEKDGGPALAVGSAPEVPPPGVQATPPSPTTQETIKLLDRGAKPQTTLRYKFQKGRTKAFTMQMKLKMSALTDGAPAQSMPETTFEFGGTTTTRDVLADGKAVRDTTFTSFKPRSAEIPPQMAEQMKRQMKSFEGMRLTETITSQGKVENIEVDESSVKSQQAQMFLRNLMEGMSNAFLPLPEEAVGVGAKWEGATTVEASGVHVTQTGTFELSSLKGSRATIKMTFKQEATPQEVSDPAMNPALKTELLSMNGQGSGQTEIDLSSLRTRGNVSIATTTKTRVTSRDVPQNPDLPSTPAGIGAARSVSSTLSTEVGVIMQID